MTSYLESVYRWSSAPIAGIGNAAASLINPKTPSAVPTVQKSMPIVSPFVRLAGISGAAAVILGAIGAHKISQDETIPQRFKTTFENGNRYHLIHSVRSLFLKISKKKL